MCLKKCDAHAGVAVLLLYTCYTVLTSSSPSPSSCFKALFERCPHYPAKEMATEFTYIKTVEINSGCPFVERCPSYCDLRREC